MPFSELKIDQVFVGPAPQDREAAKIVKVVTNLAHELGLSVCAEGVETKETLDYLRSLGCEKIQGYFIDKPLMADDFGDRLMTEICPQSAALSR
jgi:EAL domain-containing protein (putative c-di-GMP-specific phosphodiesterase class I)